MIMLEIFEMTKFAAQAVSTCCMGWENVVWTAWTASERGVWSMTKSTPRREFSTPRTNLGDATYKKSTPRTKNRAVAYM
jgi:hypothetical protein